jgi:hypothetical protein
LDQRGALLSYSNSAEETNLVVWGQLEIMKFFVEVARSARDFAALPRAAMSEHLRDAVRGLGDDHGMERSIDETVKWLCRAQDNTASEDDGVARHYSLTSGWGPSYPETTGYIVPTIIDTAKRCGDDQLLDRARRMLDWLLTIQMSDGAFQGGTIESRPIVPVVFNTGQILLGLAAGAEEFGEPYTTAMHRAARWLVAAQDEDGCWRTFQSPFAKRGERAYDAHVAWGIAEAARVGNEQAYGESAVRSVRWVMSKQNEKGWFSDCCLTDPQYPITHTLGYALRGMLEVYRYERDSDILAAAAKAADGILGAIRDDGFLPGRLDADWSGGDSWSCLTGNVQIASCLLILFQETGETRYREAGFALNRFVRRTQQFDVQQGKCGGVKGSFPVSGRYGTYEYLNWAAKFSVDSNWLESDIHEKSCE